MKRCKECDINQAKYGSYCSKCKSNRWRKKNPLRAAFVTMRYNAKRRGKEFTISFEYFKKFAIETNLMTSRGVKSESYTVDRIDNDKGYAPGNLQVLTNANNVRKQNLKQSYVYVDGAGLKVYTSKPDDSLRVESPF